jgi:hypothetical protein
MSLTSCCAATARADLPGIATCQRSRLMTGARRLDLPDGRPKGTRSRRDRRVAPRVDPARVVRRGLRIRRAATNLQAQLGPVPRRSAGTTARYRWGCMVVVPGRRKRVPDGAQLQVGVLPGHNERLVDGPRRHPADPLGHPQGRMTPWREMRTQLTHPLAQHVDDPVRLRDGEHRPALRRSSTGRLAVPHGHHPERAVLRRLAVAAQIHQIQLRRLGASRPERVNRLQHRGVATLMRLVRTTGWPEPT